ncbi:MAG: hypothetical protein ACOCZS_01100 [Verrucomicrobiota bacterium]
MDTILCPYCECRVKTTEVDDEGGVCPECGAIITPSTLLEQDKARDQEIESGLEIDDDEEEEREGEL